MTEIAETLWDLLEPAKRVVNPAPIAPRRPRQLVVRRQRPIRERYDELVIAMKRDYGLRVTKWRSSSSGCAWEVHYVDGTVARLIEAPYPTGPMSCAVFLHEVGHHAIGLETYKPRCLEEYHAWAWSLATMRAWRFNVTAAVEQRVRLALEYAVRKAKRRGIKAIPPELAPFDLPLRMKRRAAASVATVFGRA